MLKEENKYFAEILKIAGFALMTPLGKIVLNISEIDLFKLNIFFFVNLLISLVLFYFGIIFLIRGLEEVTELNNKRWTQ